jgi:alkanesulfonate monooxygenase SsuD/methylene tetrahydromethanopterin reductase-like flavin-dependent oxidoreductase (luciferase family)
LAWWLAARHADAIFVGHDGIDEARDYYRDIKSRAGAFGRDPDALFVLPAVAPVIGSTEAEAEALWIERTNLVSIEAALKTVTHVPRPSPSLDAAFHHPRSRRPTC